MFRTDLLSIIRSLNTVLFIAIGICHTSYVDCLLARSINLSETRRVLYQNKFEKQCISLAFIIKICHDALSHECQEYFVVLGHAVAQLVEALRYTPEGRGFDTRWCLWNFSFFL
jgi:hypothetical protein